MPGQAAAARPSRAPTHNHQRPLITPPAPAPPPSPPPAIITTTDQHTQTGSSPAASPEVPGIAWGRQRRTVAAVAGCADPVGVAYCPACRPAAVPGAFSSRQPLAPAGHRGFPARSIRPLKGQVTTLINLRQVAVVPGSIASNRARAGRRGAMDGRLHRAQRLIMEKWGLSRMVTWQQPKPRCPGPLPAQPSPDLVPPDHR